MTSGGGGPGLARTVALLLGAARQRTAGRLRRQSELREMRGGWGLGAGFGLFVAILFSGGVNVGAALNLAWSVPIAQRVEAETRGRVIVSEDFALKIAGLHADAARTPARRAEIAKAEDEAIAAEAERLDGLSEDRERSIDTLLRATVRGNPQTLLAEGSIGTQKGAVPDIVATLFLLWWALMLVCQGEGPEFDTQRPRHPMWEWLFSHPAPPAAIFFAEMIAPIAANPAYFTAPLYPGVLFGEIYGPGGFVVGAVLVGIPLTIALACLGKALEIATVLRLSLRSRGAVLGLMGWFGYAAMFAFIFLFTSLQPAVTALGRWLAPFADLPWPPVRLLVGRVGPGEHVLLVGLISCWIVAALLTLGAVALALAGARSGLVRRSTNATVRTAETRWIGRQPLYRKELLWFRRDGSAIVQAVLVPLSLAAMQAFNMRGFISHAAAAWNTIGGIAIVFGTYFLLILGPKSLASEGQALWIAQTWPHGLETLLKAKAKLWAMIATVIVESALIYAAWQDPTDAVVIASVGAMWFVFARSLAEKTVTLVTVPSSSGETQKVPVGRTWAATLGTLSFAIGVMTAQWPLAITGVVYSTLTAAAMWQNFRYRLPFLSDPWSETLPPPPTLMHAMIAIACMIELMAVLSGMFVGAFGRGGIGPANAIIYGICAIVTACVLGEFLSGRGVPSRDIWLWPDATRAPRPFRALDGAGRRGAVATIALGAGLGIGLGLAAHLYIGALHFWPDIAHGLDEAKQQMRDLPNLRIGYALMAVGFAPFAEEYLFRGLLYRALDREWGGWRAVVGAGAFFAVYHPALSWAPVGALGAMNAILFKRTGRLAPCVAAHMAYNAVVLAF